MKTYSSSFQIESRHIDRGNHANWRAILAIAEDQHFAFRDLHGLGIERLREEFGLFLVFRSFTDINFHKQLWLGDVIDTSIKMYITRLAVISFDFQFFRDETLVTDMSLATTFVSLATGKPCVIPRWAIEAIGIDSPVADKLVSARPM